MPGIRDFLPPLPWQGPPIPRKFSSKDEDRYIERTYGVNRDGDIWFFDKYSKCVRLIPSHELPEKLRTLFYDIRVSEGG